MLVRFCTLALLGSLLLIGMSSPSASDARETSAARSTSIKPVSSKRAGAALRTCLLRQARSARAKRSTKAGGSAKAKRSAKAKAERSCRALRPKRTVRRPATSPKAAPAPARVVGAAPAASNAVKASAPAPTSAAPATDATATAASSPPAPVPSPAPSEPARPGDAPLVGIHANVKAFDIPEYQLDVVGATGARHIREDFEWGLVEPSPGAWTWARYDRLLLASARRGITVLPVLDKPADWAGGPSALPADPSGFAAFAARVVARYGPGGELWRANPELAGFAPTFFDVWNEPYFESTSAGGVDPARYARLMRATAQAGRAANPQAKYLIEADLTGMNHSGPQKEWVDAMYAAVPDLGRFFDAVSVHPYPLADSPELYTPEQSTRWQFRRIDQIRAKFAARGDDKPLWVTEIGWTSCPDRTKDCVSEEQQAAYTRATFDLIERDYAGVIDAVFLYNANDFGSPEPSNREQYFGLNRHDGSHKPAWSVFREIALAAPAAAGHAL